MFNKATKKNQYLKIALQGTSGSGKTLSALLIAKGLSDDGRIALIDTENGSASLYSDRHEFDVCDLTPPYEPPKFTAAIKHAVSAGYSVIIVDSASHLWKGTLTMKTELDQANPKSNQYTNWKVPGAQFQEALDTVLHCQAHVIFCMRTKTEYVLQQTDNGKLAPKKLGTAPIMRDEIEFEFSTIFEIDSNHLAYSDKDRTELFIGKPPFRITEETGRQFKGWLAGNVDARQSMAKPSIALQAKSASSDDLSDLIINQGLEGRAHALFVSKGWIGVDQPLYDLDPAIASKLLKQKDNLILKLKELEVGK